MDFIANYPRTVKVYQIKNISDVDYAFRDFDEKKFNINDYERVFEKRIEPYFHYTDEDLLEDWFRIFNEYGYPKEYKCFDINCPLLHPELLEGAKLEDKIDVE